MTNEEMFKIAKHYAAKNMDVKVSEVYIVWFSKTLQNFKALASTDAVSGRYCEVTYNGDKNELYVDTYGKLTNVAYSDPLSGVKR